MPSFVLLSPGAMPGETGTQKNFVTHPRAPGRCPIRDLVPDYRPQGSVERPGPDLKKVDKPTFIFQLVFSLHFCRV